jgi:hypothetical protein
VSNWSEFGRDRPWFGEVISIIRFATGEMSFVFIFYCVSVLVSELNVFIYFLFYI